MWRGEIFCAPCIWANSEFLEAPYLNAHSGKRAATVAQLLMFDEIQRGITCHAALTWARTKPAAAWIDGAPLRTDAADRQAFAPGAVWAGQYALAGHAVADC